MDTLLAKIAEHIRNHDGFTIISHVSPDGDTLGSALALLCALKRLGRKAQLVCESAVPGIYAFLPGADEVIRPEEAQSGYKTAIAVDCADFKRLGSAGALFEAAEYTFNIDHHTTNTGYAKLNVVQADAAAVGEMMYALITQLLPSLGKDIATCLYTALLTDTGCFCYSNTTPQTHLVAAELLKFGADNVGIDQHVNRSVPYHKAKLHGIALGKLELYCEGKVGGVMLTQADISSAGASNEDCEGIIDSIRNVDSVEVALLVRESEDSQLKVSLRSKNYADVSKLASALGGGGHSRAAGCTIKGEISQVYRDLVARACALAEDRA